MHHLRYLPLLFALLWPGARPYSQAILSGRDTVLVRELKYSLDFSVIPRDGRAAIQEPIFLSKKLDERRIDSINGVLAQRLELNTLGLREADLVLSLKAVGTGRRRRQFGYRISATLAAEPSRLGYPFEQRTVLYPGQSIGEIAWADALENVLEFQTLYSLTVTADVFERVGLQRPSRVIDHTLLAVAAGGLITLGWNQNRRAERNFANHRDILQAGGSPQIADPVLDSAQSLEQSAVLMRNLGIGLLVGNALWYYLQSRKRRRGDPKVKGAAPAAEALSASPSLRLRHDPAPGTVGLRFTYIF